MTQQMTDYQNYIAKSRYSRYLPDQKRREHWPETVSRYFDFMQKSLQDKKGYTLTGELRDELEQAVVNLEVMPSMRALMTSGKALERSNVAAFNCSYLPVDDPKSFDEAMYILLCGTGVGFSVEAKNVNKLPEVPDKIFDSQTTIVVSDSKEGWAKALRQMISLLYAGEAPKWDVSKVRPAGAKLKTFGGRASGPEPLEDLFKFAIKKFKDSVGRKLTTVECHDIMCKIGEVVVVGGVRRSAMISLSDLGDDRMRHAKSGAWWEANGQRALANNSASYTERPSVGQFMEEWVSLYNSHSGERGIFNREASDKKVSENGRRKPGYEWGTNPCCFTGDMNLLTATGYQKFKELAKKPYVKIVNNNGKVTEGEVWSSGVKPVYEVRFYADKSSIMCTDDHVFMLNDGTECQAKDLKGKRPKNFYAPKTDFDHNNFLAGFAFGDGAVHRLGSTSHKGMEVYLGEKDVDIASMYGQQVGTWYSHSALEELKRYDVLFYHPLVKNLPNKVKAAPQFQIDFLAGLYSANGCVVKGQRVAFKTISKQLAEDLVSTLQVLGITAYITTNKAKMVKFDNGEYLCKPSFDVNIAQFDSIVTFGSLINFGQGYKQQDLAELIDIKSPKVSAVTYIGDQEVFDFTEPETHWGVVEGVVVHNSEIILRPYQYCNLTEVVIREHDTEETLKNKIKIATIMGTYQATLTDFPYLRSVWERNTSEESLLGVSLTGIMDNPLTSNPDPEMLKRLRQYAVDVNQEFSTYFKVPQAASITCVKPSGTVSQLVDSASGIHARHSQYYVRRVRGDNKDPLTKFMIQSGVPSEPDVMKPLNTTVFSFPIKAPSNGVLRDSMSALEQLEVWLKYARHWCEHKPSVTVSVKEEEWPEVGSWVWQYFDEVSGVSFLPHDGGTYRQAPYEECTKEEYEKLLSIMPININWEALKEEDDNVEGAQTLACSAGSCEI